MDIISQEAGKVSPRNIILGGFSQGFAMVLICLLSMGFSISGFVGISGWLPFRTEIHGILGDAQTDGDDPLGSIDASEEATDPVAKVLNYARDLLSVIDPSRPSRRHSATVTPSFPWSRTC